jgi:hypothetical protein
LRASNIETSFRSVEAEKEKERSIVVGLAVEGELEAEPRRVPPDSALQLPEPCSELPPVGVPGVPENCKKLIIFFY